MCIDEKDCTRREFCERVSQLALVAGAAICGLNSCAKSNSSGGGGSILSPGQTVTLDLTLPAYQALQTSGGSAYAQNEQIIVYRDSETQAHAFSSSCTHQGCKLPLPVNGTITCGCHQARFDTQGKVTRGPATRNLTAYNATINGTTITLSA